MRVCEHYGSRPVFLAASATIANPGELAGRLVGRDVAVIDDDGSPRGRKYFALWNPTPLGRDSLARRSASDDAVDVARRSDRSRRPGAGLHAHAAGGRVDSSLRPRATGAANIRRWPTRCGPIAAATCRTSAAQIEQDLFSGNLRGVAATNALELGIDIGTLDVALLVNYPGTIASSWQQAGRSGRRHDESLAVLLAGNDPVDQYLLRHPEYFFSQSPEHAVVDPDNPYVLAKHLPAAAFELPLRRRRRSRSLRPAGRADAGALESRRPARRREGAILFRRRTEPGGRRQPAPHERQHVQHRSVEAQLHRQRAGASPTPKSDHHRHRQRRRHQCPGARLSARPSTCTTAKPTSSASSTSLGKVAYVERRRNRLLHAGRARKQRAHHRRAGRRATRCPRATLGYGDVDVAWQTVAFKKIKFATRENIGLGPVDIPAQNLQTTAVWLAPDDAIQHEMKAAGLRASEGVCGLRNLAVVALPLVAMCDSRDLGGVVDSKNLGRTDDDPLRPLSRRARLQRARFRATCRGSWRSAWKWSATARATTAARVASACRTCGRRSTATPT